MSRIRIRTVERLARSKVRSLVSGYVSDELYIARADPNGHRPGYRLKRVPRDRPFRKRFPLPRQEWERYRGFLRQGMSLGAYDGARLVGLALVEARESDRVLWVWEFGVRLANRRRGIGRALLAELERRGRAAGFRSISLETQTTNVPALDFYRQNGFTVDRIDPDFYPKRLRDRGEIAVFMGKRLGPRPKGHKRSTRRYHDRSRG